VKADPKAFSGNGYLASAQTTQSHSALRQTRKDTRRRQCRSASVAGP
jgi:hypothetical protein